MNVRSLAINRLFGVRRARASDYAGVYMHVGNNVFRFLFLVCVCTGTIPHDCLLLSRDLRHTTYVSLLIDSIAKYLSMLRRARPLYNHVIHSPPLLL